MTNECHHSLLIQISRWEDLYTLVYTHERQHIKSMSIKEDSLQSETVHLCVVLNTSRLFKEAEF